MSGEGACYNSSPGYHSLTTQLPNLLQGDHKTKNLTEGRRKSCEVVDTQTEDSSFGLQPSEMPPAEPLLTCPSHGNALLLKPAKREREKKRGLCILEQLLSSLLLPSLPESRATPQRRAEFICSQWSHGALRAARAVHGRGLLGAWSWAQGHSRLWEGSEQNPSGADLCCSL